MIKNLKKYECDKGLVLFIAPTISEEMLREINSFNENFGKNDSYYIIPLNSNHYKEFIKTYNSEKDYLKIFERLNNKGILFK